MAVYSGCPSFGAPDSTWQSLQFGIGRDVDKSAFDTACRLVGSRLTSLIVGIDVIDVAESCSLMTQLEELKCNVWDKNPIEMIQQFTTIVSLELRVDWSEDSTSLSNGLQTLSDSLPHLKRLELTWVKEHHNDSIERLLSNPQLLPRLQLLVVECFASNWHPFHGIRHWTGAGGSCR